MPSNPKAIAFLQTANAAEDEISRRARLRMTRKDLHAYCNDPLVPGGGLHPSKRRKLWGVKYGAHSAAYAKDRHRSAAFLVGWYRQYGLI